MSGVVSKELFSLVYGYEITFMELKPKVGHTQRLSIKYLDEDGIECEDNINIDTAGRLCEDFCEGLGFDIRPHITSEGTIIVDIFEIKTQSFQKGVLHSKSKLEGKIKATEWVAREKGLLS